MANIINTIESTMATLIGGMKTTGGYNYTWGSVNELDLAKCTFPCATIDHAENFIENLDDEDGGAYAQSYHQRAHFEINVWVKLSTTSIPANPIKNIDSNLNLALDDFLKLFGTNYSINSTADMAMFKSMSSNNKTSGDIFAPKQMSILLDVDYQQDRKNPETVG